MKTKFFISFITIVTALALMPIKTFAWRGGGRSFSASGYRGSISHTGATERGYGGWGHVGSTTATGRYGNSYTVSRAARGNYYGDRYYHAGGYGAYHYGGYYGGGFGAGVAAGAAVGAAETAAYNPYYPYNPEFITRPPQLGETNKNTHKSTQTNRKE